MTVEKLERVMWRIRQTYTYQLKYYNWTLLKQTIMKEIGTDKRTYTNTVKALRALKWIKSHNHNQFILTGKDLE